MFSDADRKVLAQSKLFRHISIDAVKEVLADCPVYALAAGCQRVGMGVLIREGRFGRIAWTTALVPGGTTVAQLAFAWAPVSQAMALVMGSIVGMVVSAAVALPPTIGLLRRCRRPELRRIGLAVGRYRRFPLLVLPFHCLEIFTVRGVYLILGRWPNPNLVGWYAFADRLLTAPAALVGASIRPVFANAGSVHDIRSLGDLVTGGVRLIAALAVPGWVVAMVYADWLEDVGDPRGEFINLQLQRPSSSPARLSSSASARGCRGSSRCGIATRCNRRTVSSWNPGSPASRRSRPGSSWPTTASTNTGPARTAGS